MLAARFHGQHDIRIEDVPTPTPSAPDDILVEVHWCGICGTDLHEYAVGPIVTPDDPAPADRGDASPDAGPRVLRDGGRAGLRRA